MAIYKIYNLTNLTVGRDSNVLLNFLQETSAQTSYYPGLFILLIVFFLIFMILKVKGFSMSTAFTSASLANFIIAILLYAIKVISPQALVISIVLLPISVVLMFYLND